LQFLRGQKPLPYKVSGWLIISIIYYITLFRQFVFILKWS